MRSISLLDVDRPSLLIVLMTTITLITIKTFEFTLFALIQCSVERECKQSTNIPKPNTLNWRTEQTSIKTFQHYYLNSGEEVSFTLDTLRSLVGN